MTVCFVAEKQKDDQIGRMDVFASRLRERAAQLGISNAEVARRCGLGERQYAYYFAGSRQPNLQTLVKIANVLDTSLDVLLGRAAFIANNPREQLLDKLRTAAISLSDDELLTVVIQTQALADRKSPAAKQDHLAKLNQKTSNSG